MVLARWMHCLELPFAMCQAAGLEAACSGPRVSQACAGRPALIGATTAGFVGAASPPAFVASTARRTLARAGSLASRWWWQWWPVCPPPPPVAHFPVCPPPPPPVAAQAHLCLEALRIVQSPPIDHPRGEPPNLASTCCRASATPNPFDVHATCIGLHLPPDRLWQAASVAPSWLAAASVAAASVAPSWLVADLSESSAKTCPSFRRRMPVVASCCVSVPPCESLPPSALARLLCRP